MKNKPLQLVVVLPQWAIFTLGVVLAIKGALSWWIIILGTLFAWLAYCEGYFTGRDKHEK